MGLKKAAHVGDLEEKYCAADNENMDDVRTSEGAYVYCSVRFGRTMYRYASSIKQAACQRIHHKSDRNYALWRNGLAHSSIVTARASTSRTCG